MIERQESKDFGTRLAHIKQELQHKDKQIMDVLGENEQLIEKVAVLETTLEQKE